MSVLGTVRDILQASSQSANRGSRTEGASKGAYWCDDCEVRIRDVDLADSIEEGAGASGDGEPSCPECGEEMRFERSAASTGCAC
jgi:hypothetical protein